MQHNCERKNPRENCKRMRRARTRTKSAARTPRRGKERRPTPRRAKRAPPGRPAAAKRAPPGRPAAAKSAARTPRRGGERRPDAPPRQSAARRPAAAKRAPPGRPAAAKRAPPGRPVAAKERRPTRDKRTRKRGRLSTASRTGRKVKGTRRRSASRVSTDAGAPNAFGSSGTPKIASQTVSMIFCSKRGTAASAASARELRIGCWLASGCSNETGTHPNDTVFVIIVFKNTL